MTMILQALQLSPAFPAAGRHSSVRDRAAVSSLEYKVIYAAMLAFLAGGSAVVVHALNAVTAFH